MKSFKYALSLVLLLASGAQAVGFDQLLQQNVAQSWPLKSESTAKQLTERTLEMYLWSKDSFNLSKWPARWEQIEPQAQAVLHGAKQDEALQELALVYGLLLQDYQRVRQSLAQAPPASESLYRQMIVLLLGEEAPDRSGVWQIPLQQARDLLQKYPESALAQVVLAEALLERQTPAAYDLEQLQQAQQAVSQALALSPALDYAHYQQGQIYFFTQPEKALSYFQRQLGSLDGVAAEAVGNFYLWMNEAELAAEFYERSRQQDPGNLRLYHKLAQIYRQHAPEKLVESYFKGLAARPESVLLYQNLQALYTDVDVETLQQLRTKYLGQRSDLQAVIQGDLAILQQDAAQALQYYQEALNLNPRQLLAYLQFMEYAWPGRQIAEMKSLLQQADSLGLKHPDLQYWSGVLSLQQGQSDRAIAILTPLAAQHARSRYTLALAWHQQGDLQKSQRMLLSLLEEDPQNLSVLLTLGDLLAAEAQWSEAEKVYQLAQQLSPHDVKVYFGHAQLMGQQKKYAAAAQLWARASLLAPDSLEIRNNLGNVYIRLAQFKQARQIFEAILQQAPDYAVAHYNLACIEALQLDKEQAYRSLERALLLDADLKQTARQDPDLFLLKGDSRFQKLVR